MKEKVLVKSNGTSLAKVSLLKILLETIEALISVFTYKIVLGVFDRSSQLVLKIEFDTVFVLSI